MGPPLDRLTASCEARSPTRQSRARVGYVPHSSDLSHPGDYRRFPAYAKARGISFEIAQPGESYAVVVLSEVADIMTWADYRGGKIVYDLIDSYLAIPRSDLKQLFRGVAWFAKGRHRYPVFNFRAALERMCRRADAVVCTTEEQRQIIECLCSNVHIVLDIHDEILECVKSNYSAGSPFRVVWEGLPSNVYQIEVIRSALHDIASKYLIDLVVVTDPYLAKTIPWFGHVKTVDVVRRMFNNVTFHAWDKTTWSNIITQCDLAIIPIDLDRPLFAGKPGNKLALFWRVGMPVVTSATPAYTCMQQAAGLGRFSCVSSQEWTSALERMVESEDERLKAGLSGREYVNRAISTEALLRTWDQVLLSVGVEI